MKWQVSKWDHRNAGAPRKVFEGTEKKARSFYAAARTKMRKEKTRQGLLLLQVNTTYSLIVSQFSNVYKEGIVPDSDELV